MGLKKIKQLVLITFSRNVHRFKLKNIIIKSANYEWNTENLLSTNEPAFDFIEHFVFDFYDICVLTKIFFYKISHFYAIFHSTEVTEI